MKPKLPRCEACNSQPRTLGHWESASRKVKQFAFDQQAAEREAEAVISPLMRMQAQRRTEIKRKIRAHVSVCSSCELGLKKIAELPSLQLLRFLAQVPVNECEVAKVLAQEFYNCLDIERVEQALDRLGDDE